MIICYIDKKYVWNTNKASIANVANFLKEPIEKRRRLARYFRAYRPLRFSLSGSGVTEEISNIGYVDLSQKCSYLLFFR